MRQTDPFLDNTHFFDRQLFPQYPNPLVPCAPTARECTPPADLTGHLTSDVSAFSPSFRTPYVLQSSLNVEREIGKKLVVSGSYLYVHGEHLIRRPRREPAAADQRKLPGLRPDRDAVPRHLLHRGVVC